MYVGVDSAYAGIQRFCVVQCASGLARQFLHANTFRVLYRTVPVSMINKSVENGKCAANMCFNWGVGNRLFM